MARERNLEKQMGAKGSQLEADKKTMNIQSKVYMHADVKCREYAEAKHLKK
ncbi:hypothetical protein Dsin_014400 [Dipteronia sinensis]|uniref:Uncharacterized protein n=1 Tax=Dipteronia sinensis TaxID=43782 RepID=A0AAE0AMF8_9ROSI|nr:hypothetical protein Dsin_014400 [Dipteronia sinensis]